MSKNLNGHLKYALGEQPIFKSSLLTVVTIARVNIALDTYAQRNAKEIDRTKDQPARLPKGWKSLPNMNF